MSYHLETLGDERFQRLCQAILAASYPDVQCLPVGQPDGGRDSFRRRRVREKSAGSAVFQVKFIKDPSSREARDVIKQVIKTEKAKVERLVARGAITYHLMTNVSGTSHLDVGSIDKVNKELSEVFGIDAFCWWRDDIERRIDIHPALKWSYPEILRATDLLQALLQPGDDTVSKRRGDALRAYMAYQARYDAQLKFKQIDLQKSIIDLFVDVPARLVASTDSDLRAHPLRWDDGIEEHELLAEFGVKRPGEDGSASGPGALQLLLRENFARRFGKVVVEGARIAGVSPAGCLSRPFPPVPSPARISVSSSLLERLR